MQARAGALMAHHPAWVGHHTGGSRSKTTVHCGHFGGEAVGCSLALQHHNNEPKKTQHNDNMVAEQVLRRTQRHGVVSEKGIERFEGRISTPP